MRRSALTVFFVAVCLSQNALAIGDEQAKKMLSFRETLKRPVMARGATLNRRNDPQALEMNALKSSMTGEQAQKAELLAKEFWRSPLLMALASLAKPVPRNDVDLDDEWMAQYVETSADSIFADSEVSGLPDARLAYLNESGFARVATAVEMSAPASTDQIGPVPAADFCERSPGKDIPEDFPSRFSPWDVGSHLASSTLLDATLLQLVLKPDALDFSGLNDELANSDDKGMASDDMDPAEGAGWEGVLERFDRQMTDGSLKLTELVAKIRRDQSIDKGIRRILLAAAVSVAELKKSCESGGGRWKELTWAKSGWLEILSCRDAAGHPAGPLLAVEDGDFVEGDVEYSMTAGAFHLNALLSGAGYSMVTRTYLSGKQVGSETWFGGDGSVRAVRQQSVPGSQAFIFDVKGQVEWSRSLPSTKALTDVSWYPNGAPKSFVVRSAKGVALAMGGFHQNGNPKYWQPLIGDRADGKFLWWHPTAQIAGELDYVAGKRFGSGRLYYPNGVEGFRADYSEDSPHGRMIWRDPENKPLFTLGFSGGRPQGLLEIRYGGRTMAEARFEAGAVEGVVMLRNAHGIGVAEIPYKAGLLSGTVILRDAGGTPRVKSQWLDGQAHGDTEAFYTSGAVAANCKFDQGHLISWASFRPDSKPRYRGKVTAENDGKAAIDFFSGSDTVAFKCSAAEWDRDQCEFVTGPQKVAMPSLKELIGNVKDAGSMKFKPESCGGYTRSLDVSSLVDHPTGTVDFSYRVKELCGKPNLATELQCEIDFTGKSWNIKSCVLADDDESDD